MHWIYGTCKRCGNTFRYLTDGSIILNMCDKCKSKQYTKLTVDQIMERLATLETRVERLENEN